jgi:hypothetical protein
MVFIADATSRPRRAAITRGVAQIVGRLCGVLGQIGRDRICWDAVLSEPDLSNNRLGAEPEPTRGLTGTLDPHTLRRCPCGDAAIDSIETCRCRSERIACAVQAHDGMKVHDPAALELGDLGKREPLDAVAD